MKHVLYFFRHEWEAPKRKLMLMSAMSGLGNAILLAVINAASAQVSNSSVETRYFAIYLLSLLLFIYAQRYALTETTIAVENVMRKIRLRLANKLRYTELRFIEEMDHARIYRPFTQEGTQISFAATSLVVAAQSIVMLIAVCFYLLIISPKSLFLIVTFLTVAILFYLAHKKEVTSYLEASFQKESELFRNISYLLDGFKEIQINRKKNDALYQNITDIADTTKDLKIHSNTQLILQVMYSQITFYTLLLIIVFILPIFDESHRDVIFKVGATVLFIMGPVTQLASSIPTLLQTNISIGNIYHLEKIIDQYVTNQTYHFSPEMYKNFNEIRLHQVNFAYKDKETTLFSVGTFNLSINRNEIIFIVGGNGSGKSTLLKVMCGLYYPSTGVIKVDNKTVSKEKYQNYRDLFSIIFTDFYLFDRFYGLDDVDETRVNELLELMQLDEKTSYYEGRFTNTDLSTGQKKRLAFIVSILEDKPILLLDEFAADQDPEFRRYFYEYLLPDLKRQGRTIIAVTHDDKYFHMADRVLKMDYGNLTDFKHE